MRTNIFILLLLFPYKVAAQYSFTISGEYYGCGKVKAEIQRLYNQYVGQIQANGISTRAECEQIRASVNSINVNYVGGCGFRLKAGPCIGREMGGTLNIGAQTVNMHSAGQETSFFSTSSANEVKDWIKDTKERQNALNSKLFIPSRTIDSRYNEAIHNDLMGQLVFIPHNDINYDFGMDYLHKIFEEETGVDIEEILYKENKTQAEIELLNEYEKWRENKLSEISKIKDMAICAASPYEDFNKDLQGHSKYEKIMGTAPDEAMNRLLQLVEMCNNESMNQGFHAEILYNNETKEYVVSFRGTEFPMIKNWDDAKYLLSRLDMVGLVKGAYKGLDEAQISAFWESINGKKKDGLKEGLIKGVSEAFISAFDGLITDLSEGKTDRLPPSFHDLSTDMSQAIGKVLTQYKMAIAIGDVIRQISETNPDIKINITGHSMGGGEAIIAGAISGQPTYAFNPAGVHEETFNYARTNNSLNFSNIHKITTDDDPLTNTQESHGTVGQSFNKILKKLASSKGADYKTSVPIAYGKPYMLHTGQGHSIEPISHLLIQAEKNLERAIKIEKDIKEVKIYLR